MNILLTLSSLTWLSNTRSTVGRFILQKRHLAVKSTSHSTDTPAECLTIFTDSSHIDTSVAAAFCMTEQDMVTYQ